ncbi:MAG: thioredoxin-dependent thiol peroxidase [Anaerolineales bacterium]|nr:thioredoxin-dependent thiol peroxidase [Anaerolineales bacterium]
MTILQAGAKAPDFELQTDKGQTVTLSQFSGKKVVLFFYPKANTTGCTKEACSFRDEYADFQNRGIAVLGISPDSVKAQANFSGKYNFPYFLLADADHKTAEAYGVWAIKKMYGKEYYGILRTTFIINEDGTILHVFEKVKPENHAQEVLEFLDTL